MEKTAELGLVVNMKVVGVEISFPTTCVMFLKDFCIKSYAKFTN